MCEMCVVSKFGHIVYDDNMMFVEFSGFYVILMTYLMIKKQINKI